MESIQKVPLSDSVYRRLLGCKDEITDLFLKRFRCNVDIMGPKLDTTPQVPSFPAEKVYERRVISHVVSVWKDDLTRHPADAVVNAANEDLDHAGGLARALADAGGPQVYKDSRDYVTTQGRLKTGGYAVTRPGNLPCKCLLHAVGPMWASGIADRCDSELRECIGNVLKYIEQNANIKSVAIPAVSSGIFGFPLDRCANVIVYTINSFCYNVTSQPKEIRLVNIDDPTVQAMKAACERILGPSDDLRGPPSATHNPTTLQTHSQTAMRPTPPATHNMPQTITINGLKLHLKTGLIQEQHTTVIVNSVGTDVNLKIGEISLAILNKAGYEIQSEISRKKQNALNATMIPTMGYKLPCQWVYHAILQYNTPFAQVMKECLDMAHGNKCPSISFPALGTGLKRIPKDTVARIMTEAVVSFAKEYRRSMDVYFVIYPNDLDTYKAFQRQLSLYSGDTNMESDAENKGHTSNTFSESSRSEETCLLISGPNLEAVAEANAWLKDINNFDPFIVQNNHILLLGSKEHEVLSSLESSEASIHEDLSNERSALTIKGPLLERLCAAIQVERLLLGVQEEQAVVLEEELVEAAVIWFYQNDRGVHRYPAKANRELEKAYMTHTSDISLQSDPHHKIDMRNRLAEGKDGKYQIKRRPICDYPNDGQKMLRPDAWLSQTVEVNSYSHEFRKCASDLLKDNLKLVKMEKVDNRYLSAILQSKKGLNQKNTKMLYQVVPRQFTRQVCDVGFQRLYTYPKDMKFGEGIYFKENLKKIPECFQSPDADGLLRIFMADVLIDAVVQGRSDMSPLHQIWDNSKVSDILDLCNCRVNNYNAPNTFVILDGFRANPQYLLTCHYMASSSV